MKRWILAALLAAPAAQADFEWAQKELKMQTHPTQVSADAIFRFSNEGNAPIKIERVKVSCSCLAPKLTKRTYASGEKGELTIQLDLRNRIGKQHKTVLVTTSDGVETKLSIITDIPEAYTVESKNIIWKIGDEEKIKTLRLKNPNADPIELRSLTSSNSELPTELKTIREGFEYEVIVTRNTDQKNARSVIRISLEPPAGQTQSKTLKLYVYAQ